MNQDKMRKQQTIDAVVARIYMYLKEEYNFMRMFNTDNCNIKPLSNCKERTAKATGVYVRGVTKALTRTRAQQKKLSNKILNEQSKGNDDCIVIEDDMQIIKTQMCTKKNNRKTMKNVSQSSKKLTNVGSNSGRFKYEANEGQGTLNQIVIIENDITEYSATEMVQVEVLPSTSMGQIEYSTPSIKKSSVKNHPNLQQLSHIDDEVEESSNQLDANTETYIVEEVRFLSSSIKQEEVEMLPLSNTMSNDCTDIYSVLQFEEDEESDTDSNIEHVTPLEQEELELLPISNKLTANEVKKKIEVNQEFDAVSDIEQDCYIVENIEEEVNASDKCASERYNCFNEHLPSSCNSTKHIEFVCIKNEVHSDLSD